MPCSSCGRENPEDSRFCSACGAPLPGEAAAGVRKTVTVVFCDLVGSTALGERTDPEVLRELMGRYHAELRAILERHGGTVEKFVGDAAMAVFGLPQVHEDDALRALRAALEMRDAVAALGLEVRIGVNTGEVVAGTGETLVTGDAVNVAARLEQAAGTGEVLIGAATERLVRQAVRSAEVPPLTLKGKAEPVPAFRAIELLDDVPAFTRPIDAPFVGRAEELGRLEGALRSAVETGTPHLATIVGPPGIGKSRLARELLGRAGARIVVGRCLPYGEGITYWPLAEIVGQIRDLADELERQPDAELVATRIGAAFGTVQTTATPEEIAWGFRRLLEAIAAEAPLVVVFDDIHWAEPVLLDLIEYVLAFAQGVPLFVLCTARPELFEVRPTWATPKPEASVITLGQLTGADSETLVIMLGTVPDETRARIVEAAEGNPLFVEQLVAMLEESPGEELEVPPTLRALLDARIDRLTGSERAVAERGAVEGRLFHRGAVTALLPESERPEVGGHLLTLVRKELIRADRATLAGDDGFRFAHLLIRDATYEAIPKRQRAALHEGFAVWLETRLGDDAPDEIVGYHLEQAYRYGAELGAPDPALGAAASERLAAAGRAARSRRDVAAVANLLGRAVELLGDADRDGKARLLVVLGEALQVAGETERSRATLDDAASLAASAGDHRVEWLARIALARVALHSASAGAVETALREGEAAVAALEVGSDEEVLAKAWDLLGLAHNARSDVTAWQGAIDQALVHARRSGDLALEVEITGHSAGTIVYGPATVDEGLRFVDDVSARLGHVPEMQGLAIHVSGHMRARLGQHEGAYEDVMEFRRRIRELGQDAPYAVTAGCVWDVCLLAEDWERAEAALREAYEMLERMGMRASLAPTAAFLGEAVLRQGRLDEADRLSQVSAELSTEDDPYNGSVWRRLRAKVLAARGDLGAAMSMAREGVELIAGLGFLDDEAEAWLDLAGILRAAGDDTATEAATEALALYERKGNRVGAGRVRSFIDADPV